MKRYIDKIFDEVTVEADLLFATAPGYDDAHTETPLHLDVYTPAGDTEQNRRAVILVHGGGFCSLTCDKQQGYVVTLARLLAQYGYVCFSIDYRLFTKENRPPYREAAVYAAADIETARRWITANAARFGIDPTALSICGGSAGGMGSIEACRLYPDYRAFVCLWGAYADMDVPAAFPPTIVIHGTADKLVPCENGIAFHRALEAGGIDTELIVLEDAPHTAIKWLPDFESSMIDFLDRHA